MTIKRKAAGLLVAALVACGLAVVTAGPSMASTTTTTRNSTVTTSGVASDGSVTSKVSVHGGTKVRPNVTVECQALVTAPYQIVKNTTWYAQAKITECSTPPPLSCSLQVSLQELTPNEWGGEGWSIVKEGPANTYSCQVGFTTNTGGYTCLSNLALHDFRSQATLIVTASTTGFSTWTSGTEAIPCE